MPFRPAELHLTGFIYGWRQNEQRTAPKDGPADFPALGKLHAHLPPFALLALWVVLRQRSQHRRLHPLEGSRRLPEGARPAATRPAGREGVAL
jgi:hypothetical protein